MIFVRWWELGIKKGLFEVCLIYLLLHVFSIDFRVATWWSYGPSPQYINHRRAMSRGLELKSS